MTMIQIEAATVPEILRATRALAGLTVREIAPLIGVSHGTVSAWERGQGEPSVTHFLRWAQATKQPAQQLLDGLNVEVCTPRGSNPEPTDSEAFWTIDRELVLLTLAAEAECVPTTDRQNGSNHG